jgi:hypothetical protein
LLIKKINFEIRNKKIKRQGKISKIRSVNTRVENKNRNQKQKNTKQSKK